MKKLNLSMDLKNRGMALIVVPLCTAAGFLVLVALNLKQYDAMVEDELHFKQIDPTIAAVSATLSDCEVAAMLNPVHLEQYNRDKKILQSRLDELAKLSAGDAARMKRVDEIKEGVNKTVTVLDKVVDRSKAPNGKASDDESADTGELLGNGFEAIDRITVDEEQAHQEFKDQIGRMQGKIRETIFLSMLVNLLVAAGLVFYYIKTVSKRFRVLTSNANRLAQREPLNPPLQGNDEIAVIDGIFHRMAAEVMNSDQQKRQLVGLVRQGMKETLSAAHQVLHKLTTDEQRETNPKIKQRLLLAERDTERLLKLVSTLLDIQAIEAGKFELNMSRVSAAEIIDAAVASVEEFATSRGVIIRFAPPAVKIVADSQRLTQVMVNLLNNAIKYSPQGGTVVVDVVEEEPFTEIRVTDEGGGLGAQYHEKIFDAIQFGQGETLSKGASGLGLVICKAIVEQHGGTIGVESAEGEGCSFWFRLPRTAA